MPEEHDEYCFISYLGTTGSLILFKSTWKAFRREGGVFFWRRLFSQIKSGFVLVLICIFWFLTSTTCILLTTYSQNFVRASNCMMIQLFASHSVFSDNFRVLYYTWWRPNLTILYRVYLSHSDFNNWCSVDADRCLLCFLWIIQRIIASLNAKRGKTQVPQATANPEFLSSIIEKRIWS